MAGIVPHRRALLAGLGSALAIGGTARASGQDAPAVGAVDLDRRFLTRLAAPVTLNSRHRRVFLLDTGAAATSLSDTVAAELALPAREPVLVHGTTGAQMAPSVEVDRLRLEGQLFHDLRCPVFPRTQLGADGLVGLDVLERYRVVFDMVRRQAGLGAPPPLDIGERRARLRPPRNGVSLTRGPLGQLIVDQVGIDGQEAVAVLDSGSEVSVGNPALLSAIGARRNTGFETTRVEGVDGRPVWAEAEASVEVRIGEARVAPFTMPFADLYVFGTLDIGARPAVLIGADILSRFRWVQIDFANDILTLEGRTEV